MNKRLVALCILLVGLIIVAVVYFRTTGTEDDAVPLATDKTVTSKDIVKTEVPVDKVPDKFPTGIPIEAGATITQNYNATAPDGRFQATRVFETKKTLAENLVIYKDYLTKTGYEVQSTVDQEKYKMVFGTKGDGSIQVSIDQNTVSNVKTVSISYTEQSNSAPTTKNPAAQETPVTPEN